MKDQNLITILLAMYGTWQLAGRLARWLLRRPLRPKHSAHLLPRPDYSVKRSAERLYSQHMYIRRMERQG